jgi:hypothetical protein
MEQHEETNPTSYPLGRGYGHDYMRGGEVFGGYGYRDREDYLRARDGTLPEVSSDEIEELEAAASTAGVAETAERSTERSSGARHEHGTASAAGADREGGADAYATAPVPHLERTYGDTGSAWRHSRSFYVTQAQLQQRIYAPQRRAEGPYRARIQAVERSDEEIEREVREALFHDTWVDAQSVAVEVSDGHVTLRGELPSAHEIRFARDDAWSVPGVREVICELTVREGA